MARIRSIHPDFPSDKSLAKVSRDVRLTYVCCWCVADDAGLFRASPRQLVGQLFPYDDDVTEAQLEAWLVALVDLGKVRWLYTRDGARVGQVVSWKKRQKIDKPSKSFLQGEIDPLAGDPREARGAPSIEEGGGGEGLAGASRHESRVLSLEPRVLSPEPGAAAARFASLPRYSELIERLPEKAHAAVDGYLRSARHPEAVVAAILDEGPDTGINAAANKTWPVIGQALCDLQASGEPFKPVLFRAYINRLLRDPGTSADGRSLTDAERMRAAADRERAATT